MDDPDRRALDSGPARAVPASRKAPLAAQTAAAIAFSIVAAMAFAVDAPRGDLRVEHPFARATPPGARTAGIYVTLRNAGKAPERLLRATSPAAAGAELHSMTMDGTTMRMRAVGHIDILPGATVVLGSGGYHVMLVGLARPLVAGEPLPLTLIFEKAGSIDVSVTVEPMTGGAAGHGAAHAQ